MRKPLVLLTIVCCIAVCASGPLMARSRTADVPHRYQPASEDRQLVQVENPLDGRTWSAWAFRSGAEYDIALAVLDESGVWSEPVFFGGGDGHDQVDPAFVVHESGLMLVAFAEPEMGRILVSMLPPGGQRWSTPAQVARGEDLRSPAMMTLGERIVLAFRAGDRVEMKILSFADEPTLSRTRGNNDGPDPVGVPGVESEDPDPGDEEDEGGDTNPSDANKIGKIRMTGGRDD